MSRVRTKVVDAIRYWLIVRLAGKQTVLVNAEIHLRSPVRLPHGGMVAKCRLHHFGVKT